MTGIDNWLALSPERHRMPSSGSFRLRRFRPDGSIGQFMAANGFVVLERTASTYVLGLVARRGGRVPVRDPVSWREPDRRQPPDRRMTLPPTRG